MKIVRDDHKPIHLVYDKARFLEENLEEVTVAGVEYYPDNTVLDLKTSSEAVTVHTSKQRLKARFVVAADGHNSLCARLAGFNRDRQFYGTLSNACWYLQGFEPEEPAHIHLVEGKGGPAIFCLNPRFKEGEYNVMISGFSPYPHYREKLEQVIDDSFLSPYFKNIRIVHRLACILNLFHPLAYPCRNNVFVIGDAAWMGQTSNTHAALTGLKAVECIFEAVKEKKIGQDVYEPYQKWWDENFARHIKAPGVNMFDELTRDEIDEFFSYMPEEIEGSMEPTKAQRLLGAFFQKLIPDVQKKNPQLVRRIQAIQQRSPDEAWKEKRSAGFPAREKVN
jgi:flavin-dependent dehydrogenase